MAWIRFAWASRKKLNDLKYCLEKDDSMQIGLGAYFWSNPTKEQIKEADLVKVKLIVEEP